MYTNETGDEDKSRSAMTTVLWLLALFAAATILPKIIAPNAGTSISCACLVKEQA